MKIKILSVFKSLLEHDVKMKVSNNSIILTKKLFNDFIVRGTFDICKLKDLKK